MSILPTFITDNLVTEERTTKEKVLKEYAINFKTGQPTGGFVYGKDALKVWVWLALQIERYRFPIYSWNYGMEMEQYIGKNYSQEYLDNDLKKSVEDALKVNSHISGIENFTCIQDSDKITMNFTLITDYGEVEVGV